MPIINTLPNTIANGQLEDAVPVMANFNWILSQVNGNACPATAGSGLLKGNGTGGTTTAAAGTDYAGITSANTFTQLQSGIAAVADANFPIASQVQASAFNTGTVSGTVDAITAAFAPVFTALTSAPVWWRATGANTSTTPTFKRDGLVAKTIVKGANQALVAGDIPGAGAWMCSQYDAVLDSEVLLNPALGVASNRNIVGSTRNLAMSVSAAAATATLTADEIFVESALGASGYKLGGFNKSVNLATIGAGGIDAGSAPASGYVALYAIYNPTTGASALLATNATASVAGNIYGGANMPAGYTASALVSVWPTNGSSQFIVGYQEDRNITLLDTGVLSGTVSQPALASLSISTAVPPNAKKIKGWAGIQATTNSTILGINIASNTAGLGQLFIQANGAININSPFSDLVLQTAQQIAYSNTCSGTIFSQAISITGYSI